MAIEGELQPGREYVAEFRAPGWVLSWIDSHPEGAERLARYVIAGAGNSGRYEVRRVDVGPGQQAPDVDRLRVFFQVHEAITEEQAGLGIGRAVMWAAGVLGLTGLLLVGIYAVGADGPLGKGAERLAWLLAAGAAAWVVTRWG